MRPASGRSKPAIRRSVVVFPEPDGPSMVKNSPRAMSSSTSSTATTGPYVFRRPETRTSAACASASARAANRLLQDRKTLFELVLGDRQRRQQTDDIAVHAA